MQEPNYIEIISKEFSLKNWQVENTLKLIEEQNTVPFIARYRKERTGNLDENIIRKIVEFKEKEENIYKAKVSAIENIDKQGKLTDALRENIEKAQTLKEVEDLYAPFKLKKKTKAMIAREKGFEPVAIQIREQKTISIPKELLENYSEEEIVEGAKDIVSQDIADDADFRKVIRIFYNRFGEIKSTFSNKTEELPEKTQKQVHKFEIYYDFEQEVTKLKSYQILALNRGESLGIIKVKLINDQAALELLEEEIILTENNIEPLKTCVKEGYKKIFTSIETEIRNELTTKAHEDAIKTFQINLKKLLMTKPQYGKSVLAIDPAFRTGCKIAVLSKENKPLEFSKIYLEKENEGINVVSSLISKYSIDVIVIGNGTASNETLDFVRNNFSNIPSIVVNESGASMYSASQAANEEFPELDLTDRGTISIGRRYIDPLSELVKIPPHNIGVGMYQHDVNQKELERKLNYVVEDVVNLVGINVNTASVHILKYISGLNAKSAKKIIDNIPYSSRSGLKKVLSAKAFEQAAGFLRVPQSKEVLDNTSIHPEQYEIARFIIQNNIKDYSLNEKKLKEIYSEINKETFDDILKAYAEMGKDPRIHEATLNIEKNLDINDLEIGQVVKGIVRNITQFGAFVDIGLKNDGLVHISQLADKFVKDPHEIVEVGQEVEAKVLKIDLEHGKVNLSMRDLDN